MGISGVSRMLTIEKPAITEHIAPKALSRGFELSRGVVLLVCASLPPWLFGTTENWAIWTMNLFCYGAGLLLLYRFLFLRRPGLKMNPEDTVRWVTLVVAGLAAFVLLFCMISAINARATFLQDPNRLEYHPYLRWLPFT